MNAASDVAMARERVPRLVARLVGPAEAVEVRRDHARAGGGERRDHPAVEIRPGRLTVQAEERVRRGARTFVDVVHPQAGQRVDVMRRERKAGKPVEARVGGA